MNSERELEKWQKVNSAETKEQLFEAVDFICANEPNGLIGTTGKLFTADKLKRSINAAITGRFNADVVSVLKRAKELFVTHPEYWGMCFCIEHAMAGTERGITSYSHRDIVTMIPEFNREFLEAPKDRYGKAYWWTPDSEEGHNARVKAFDKLIKYYELDKKNHE